MAEDGPNDYDQGVEMEVVVIMRYEATGERAGDEAVRRRIWSLQDDIHDRLRSVGQLSAWSEPYRAGDESIVILHVSDSDGVLQKIQAALKGLNLPPGSSAERRPVDMSKVDMRKRFKDSVDLWTRPRLP